MTNNCWCGKPGDYKIKQSLPAAEIVTHVCSRHRDTTFAAIKWHLVAKGVWLPGCLTMERVEALGEESKG